MSAFRYPSRASGSTTVVLVIGALIGLVAATAVAGDLLRGGYSNGSQGQAANPGSFTSPSMSEARANMQDALARATQTIQAVRQMQGTAQSIAARSGANNLGINPNHPSAQLPNVPNGLGIGALDPVAGATAGSSLWTGANLPTQTKSNGLTVVTVNQTSPDAVLTWQSFSVGRATALDFNQGNTGASTGNSIVFNIVQDPSGVPSQILGSINAQGQVYVINQNGIIFGGASQVNVHTLVASSLPINTNLISRGLLNNPDDQFLFSQLSIPAGTNGPTPAFTPPAPVNATDGNVTVLPGAQITAPDSADSVGGRVVLVGPNVTNAGTISAPDGQTILAAGDQVGFVASSDPSLRGLDTFIGAVDATSGNATNSGDIEVPRGDVMIAGESVNQLGVIDSTTSVTLNGRVDLDADYGANVVASTNNTDVFSPTATGLVTLGPGSETQILPELSSPETVVGTSLALPSQINIQGASVHFATDSQILAPNANVTVSAGGWYQSGNTPAVFIPNGGQIYLDAGATIDVAGSIVTAPVSENIVSAQLLGPEFADSPLQRNGVLYGQTIEVDARETGIYDGQAWVGTPLANVSGYIDLIQRPVGELTTAGGTVSLTAGGSVVMQQGSLIDVSGGGINYQGGMVQTTSLISGGEIINIADATANLVYQEILGNYTVDYAKWGIEESFTTPLVGGPHYEESYIEGGNGGSIVISAPSVALDGAMEGQTYSGSRQLQIPPAPSSFTLSFQMQDTSSSTSLDSPTPPNVYFEPGSFLPPVPAFALDASGNPIALPADRMDEVILSPELLTQNGFGSLTVNDGDGNITVPVGVALAAPAFGSITFSAANLSIAGSVTAPDGSLDFTVYDYSPYAYPNLGVAVTPPANPARGNFVLSPGASLSAAGLIVDNLPFSPRANTGLVAINGGSITIASFSANLAAGSTIDVSGGVEGNPTGSLTYGTGGAISINAGQDPNSDSSTLGGTLTMEATLKGFSGSTGGSLTIRAPAIQIGGSIASNPDALLLQPSFFSEGGFTSFSLTGLGSAVGDNPFDDLPGIVIEPGAVIAPVAESLLGVRSQPDGENVTLRPILLPEAQRTPVSLSFSAPGVKDPQGDLVVRGDFVMGNGAAITTDALGSVSISANAVSVFGSITTPGGKISITGASDSDAIFVSAPTSALATVYLGPDAMLSAAGTTVLTPDVYGYPTGSVVAGGSITLSGNIVAAAGSTLNVSGASGVLYLPQADTTVSGQQVGSFLGAPVVPVRVDSSGGSITLSGAQELFTDATLIGKAGGPAATGGNLSISSGIYIPPGADTTQTPTDPTLVVSQSGATIPEPAGIGQQVFDAEGNSLSSAGEGHIAADSFLGGGFNDITLAGTVQFNGGVLISAAGALSVGNAGVIIANGAVTLSAPYVVLGLPFQGPLTPEEAAESPFTLNSNGAPVSPFDPTSGPGSLTVVANLIDIGNLSMQGISQASFIAANGDIRGDGTLDVAGQVSMTAGQVYPASDATFEIAAYDKNIVVASAADGSTQVTLASAALPPGFGAGSPLLGSTVQSIDGTTVTLASGADASIGTPTAEVYAPGSGSVTIHAAGARELPLSAGGTLEVYASNIVQDGVLRAPIGTINLGWNGPAGTAPTDPITGAPMDSTLSLTLGAQSITSVSAVDPLTGQPMIIPYGSNPSGTEWLDPAGNNITAGGVPEKTINLAGAAIYDDAGSVIDISGGGDLASYRFVAGEGGSTDFLSPGEPWNAQTYSAGQLVSYKGSTWVALQQTSVQAPAINQYWSQVPASYAVIPGYQAGYAPYAPFNSVVGDPGYVSAGLQVGQQVYLGAGNGLAAGVYTLLPARYALLPGAYLVTPETGSPTLGQTQPDGSNLVSGYLFNGLSNPGGLTGAVISRFEVDSQSVVLSRGQYDTFLATSFLAQGALQNKTAVPLLPNDAGVLNIDASSELELQGMVNAQAPAGGIAGFVDINSTSDIYITSGHSGPAGTLTLDSSELSSFDAGTLLIGGVTNGTTIDVETNNIEVNNAGASLEGSDVILAANDKLILDPGAEVAATAAITGEPQSLLIQDTTGLNTAGDTLAFAKGGVPIVFPQGTPGNDSLTATVGGTITLSNGETTTFSAGTPFTLAAGSTITLSQGGGTLSFAAGTGGAIPLVIGDGALLRVSSDPDATIARSGAASSEAPALIVGAGATISGASVILNSTDAITLNPTASVGGYAVTLGSGQISIALNNPGPLQPAAGLVLNLEALSNLQVGESLSLLSYSSIDVYGNGGIGSAGLGNLELDAAEIRGFGGGGPAVFEAQNILLDNSAGGTGPGPLVTTPVAGTALDFDGGTIALGANQIDVDQFANVELHATGGVVGEATGGLAAQGALEVAAPVITGMAGSNETISAQGTLNIQPIAGANATVTGGLGATLILQGAAVTDNSSIVAQSGQITLHATSGDVTLGNLAATRLDAGGASSQFFDLTAYTSGGGITLTSDAGTVRVGSDATLDVAAQAGGGNAGTLTIGASQGIFDLSGAVLGQGGAGGENGTFSLDAGSIPGGNLGPIDALLSAGGFTRSVSIRDRNDAVITVDGVAKAQTFNLSADSGSITVTGLIDASGVTGGTINLIAAGSVTLDAGSELTVAGQAFNAAGQGGSVSLQGGAYTGGNFSNVALGTGPQVNIAAGSFIDLSVASNGNATATAANAALGEFTGTLIISAPQALGNTDLQVQPIDGTIKNASSIIVEGNQVFEATDGSIDNQENNILSNGQTFVGVAGSPATASYTALVDRLFANNMGLITPSGGNPAVAVIEPGAEIVNPNGDLTLSNDWDLESYRYGPVSAPGVLTVRASGNLIFDGALSDGFTTSSPLDASSTLWQAVLMPQNTLLPVNAQDTSYNLTAGADFSAANIADVLPVAALAGSGSIEIGINDPDPYASQSGLRGTTESAVLGYFQVIRTGAGSIDISAGGNVELLNQFATIYTAGTQVVDATMGGTFSVPTLDESENERLGLGAGSLFSPGYPAQYSEGGGDVTISAQEDIEHLTQDENSNLIMDSESELPENWLYRRGDVGASGVFDSNTSPDVKFGGDPSESTTWWVDFSNFFEGVGALGGGNVTMIAGVDIANVDAVIPTNARMPGTGPSGNLAPNAGSLLQLGGGDLLVQAGNDINGGVYYVESGQGAIIAGNQIHTNSTRAPVGGTGPSAGTITAPTQSWLPTTLFAGDASFDVTAGGDLLLGPVANPFMLPEGLDNSIWYKTYFSTYATSDVIDVTSLGGSITFREDATTSNQSESPILQVWLENMDLLYQTTEDTRAYYQPWLRLNETNLDSFGTVTNLMPSTLLATAFSGDINIVGTLLLSPSPTGTLDLAAAGSINGFQSLGPNPFFAAYTEATIDLSDANPSNVPGITSPFGYQEVPGVGTVASQAGTTGAATFLSVFNNLFDATETGASGTIETEQALHDSDILHAGDSTPVYLYAEDGDISGVTLYSPTETRIVAGGDITDIAFYLQNDAADAISVISAGGDIAAYDPSSPARSAAELDPDSLLSASLPGDIQVGGPGTLEVLAGANLELGGQGPGGPSNTTGDGIATVGNTLNPALPFAGADIVAAAGIGGSDGLGSSELDFGTFISQIVESAAGATYLGELSQINSTAPPGLIAGSFQALVPSEQDRLALDVFFLALRDAGRDHNDPGSAGYGNYTAGLAAIRALFPAAGPGGDIDVTSRDIVTESGGNISLLAPNGDVTVGLNSSEGDDVTNLGIVTQDGGNISIFTSGDVNVGTSRIFTLRGGNEVIWSSDGNIDAGASSKTVQSAPPTRVLVDPQSGDVQTDLAGLATGGGIGVLASVAGVAPGNVDLIAPAGFVNAGEAGIRATGNLNIAAVAILNAGNIAVGGASTGLPPAVVGPNIAGLTAASSAAGSAIGSANSVTAQQSANAAPQDDSPSIISVQVVGYGGGDGDD